jgi:signal transduction histidine kinase
MTLSHQLRDSSRAGEDLAARVDELERVGAERQRLALQLLSAHAAARERIANDLHDESIQGVSSVGMRLDMLSRELSESPDQREAVARLRETVAACLERLRELVVELQAPPTGSQTLPAALRIYLEQVERQSGLSFQLEVHDWREPHEAGRLLLYRLVQEAVHEARSASGVRVSLERRDDLLVARVAADRVGFDANEGGFEADGGQRPGPGRLGLPLMGNWLQILGGSLRIESTPGHGSLVEIGLPDIDPGGAT